MALSLPEYTPHLDDSQPLGEPIAWPRLTSAIDLYDLEPYHEASLQPPPRLQVVRELGSLSFHTSTDDCDIHDDLALARINHLYNY